MIQVVSVYPPAGNISFPVVGRWTGTLAGALTGPPSVKFSKGSARRSRVSVVCIVGVDERPGDCCEEIDGKGCSTLAGTCSPCRKMKGGELAVDGPDKALIETRCVREVTGDRTLVVDAGGARKARRSGGVDDCDLTVLITQETMKRIAGIRVRSSNFALPIQARLLADHGEHRPWGIDRREPAVARAQKAVFAIISVDEDSCGRSLLIE